MPGIAYSFYPLLYNLAAPCRPHHQKAVKAIEPFSMFAFVICSPDKNDGVRDVLARHFSFLDVATADRLLFYAPIDEPPEWRGQRESCQVARSLFDFHDFVSYSCRSHDPRGTEHALAVTLGIDLQELPAIVLTTDPRSSDYLVLRTSREHVRQQLVGLGDLAQDITPIRDRHGDATGHRLTLEALRDKRLDACGGLTSPELLDNLADALHQVLSMALVKAEDPGHAYYAQSTSFEVLHKLRQQIDQARRALRAVGDARNDAEDSHGSSKVFQLCERLATYIAMAKSDLVHGSSGSDRPGGWDADSLRWLLLGDRVKRVLDGSGQEHRRGGDAVDYSPAAVCWCKAFEAELGYSLAHWVREILGVQLPPYYGKVQEGVQAVFSSSDGRFSVDFNRRRRSGDDAWKPPELGVLQGPVFHYFKHQESAPVEQAKRRLLQEKWETIRQVRNEVCHPYPVNRERAILIREALDELNRQSVLSNLVRLKRQLKGEPDEPDPGASAAPADPTPGVSRPWWKFWRKG
jgi:hypothetical protein